ncbi:NIMA related kinase 4 [Homo sapiens]|uniref:Isoform 2 of Serine/threonine-protein kinase Nek4 n=1 Tax=Homo sapiens TaxID=9606 RepID=P51957-2|nr:serine/threonine-protein kinase Nek4 isoform 4 [Homo sapiens]KAI2530024.1 NIMA related kinase 4 [Homo sapiens]KAI4030092.1 NIMA related kinase 4 [Homo sapiens]|eukprot:NP_001335342.1 serine/threonine-protein kinase Nek4 isoform 4 [Homo sapiens]
MPLAAYCYLRVVGKGSYGEVTLVKHRRDGKQYVIKKLNLRNASSRERRAAEQEAQLLSQLKHPNIVTYKESWEGGDGLLYIVMGFCEGGDLYRKLKEQKGQLLPENQVVEWFVQIAMALQYLHEKHILHRDLKTQNVFLTRTNIIKVGDLGIARVLENHCDMASTLIGTPYYMSPELFSNKPYNYKSDVWALGCCVYEMATLKHAFNAKDMNSLVYRIIEGKLPPMPRDYSPELAELIRTMLSKRPEERPSVRSILRQPYIKRQISFFLEATKIKTSKNNIKNGDSQSKPFATVVSGEAESNHEVIHPQPLSSEGSQTYIMGEGKCLSQEKPRASGLLKSPASLKAHTCKQDLSNTTELATISSVNIDILPAKGRDSVSDGFVQENQPRYLDASNELGGICSISQVEEEMLQDNTKSSAQPENLIPMWSSDIVTGEKNEPVKPLQPLIKEQKPKDQDQVAGECIIEKQGRIHPDLQPHNSGSEPSLSRQRRQKRREQTEHRGEKRQVRRDLFAFQESPPRFLPSHPIVGKVDVTSTQKEAENQRRVVTGSVSSSRSSEMSSSKDRPLSARERRRLKQSQEEMSSSGPSVRKASLSVAGPGKPQEEDQPLPARRLSSDCSVTQERKQIHCLSEDELSSSTSSTDKSDGDYGEGKGQTNEINALVQLMTQTLKLDSKESCEDVPVANPVSEFKLHRKYRDTLILHGKVAEEAEEIHFKELPSAIMPGSEKIRRLVEVLRTDVIRGLGVQLLEQVYDLLEEEDEFDREVSVSLTVSRCLCYRIF